MFSLIIASALLRKEGLFLSKDADPTCKSGVVSADLYACCPKSCGSCDDGNEACTGAGGDLAAQEQGGCCPSKVKEGARQCENVSPPCILGDDYRNPPNADALDILANTKIHAKDDCGEVKGEHAKEMRVATHFVKKTGVKVTEPGHECGTYSEIDDAAEACRVKEDCVGFSLKDGKPDCFFSDFGLTSTDEASELYIKVKNQAGASMPDGQKRFQRESDQALAAEGADHTADVAEEAAKAAAKDAKRAPEEMKAEVEATAAEADKAAVDARAAADQAEAAPDAAGAAGAEEEAVDAAVEATAAEVGIGNGDFEIDDLGGDFKYTSQGQVVSGWSP